MDAISIKYGVLYIVMGLFIEVFVEATKIPMRFLEGGPIESGLVILSVALSFIGFCGSILFTREILLAKNVPTTSTH